MSTYYTPSIEEFHVGFEFEVEDLHDNLVDRTWRPDSIITPSYLLAVVDWLTDKLVRVKHLDRSDIESFKFFHDQTTKDGEFYFNQWDQVRVIHKDGWVQIITPCSLSVETSGNFSGRVKNKSELKKVMQQIGII